MKKYNFIVTENAVLECDKGISYGAFRPLSLQLIRMKIDGQRVSVETDVEVYGFKFCSQTQELCCCVPGESWNNACKALLEERQPVVCAQSSLLCKAGGIITVKDPGQKWLFEENDILKYRM